MHPHWTYTLWTDEMNRKWVTYFCTKQSNSTCYLAAAAALMMCLTAGWSRTTFGGSCRSTMSSQGRS